MKNTPLNFIDHTGRSFITFSSNTWTWPGTSSMAFYKMIYMSKKFLTLDACTKFILNCDERLSQFTIVNRQMLEIFLACNR